jgi:chromosome partitioning protein
MRGCYEAKLEEPEKEACVRQSAVLLPSHRARIVMVASPKGGVGKTTLSMNLLVVAARADLQVIGIDFDPQRNLEKWQHRRRRQEEVAPIEVIPADLSDWHETLAQIRDYDLVVLDTPPSIEDHMVPIRRLTERADLILVPTGYGPLDLDSVTPWMAALARDGHGAAFCLNRVNRRTRAFRAAQQRLVRYGRLCPVEIPQLEEILTCTASGLTVLDADKAKGIEDIEAVWNFVRREISL